MTTPASAMTPEKIRERSERFADLSRLKLQQAQEELDQGDTARASEKAYGALIEAAKACGELRGWNHSNHHRTELIIEQLAKENQSPNLVIAHMAAMAQRFNYFGHEQSSFYVKAGIDTTAAAIEKLDSIRTQAPLPSSKRDELTPEDRRRLPLLNQSPEKQP